MSFRDFLTTRHGSTDDTLLDSTVRPTRDYRDVLNRSARLRPDGTPVWPLRDSDLPSRKIAA